MESAGEWLEKALVELCSKMETGLGLGLDEEIIKGLVSYCDFAEPRDAKEYLDNIIGQEAGKTVIEEYLRRRGYSELSTNTDVSTTKLHAYVKPPSVETSASGTKKSFKTPKTVTVRSNHAEPNKNAVGGSQENQTSTTGNESKTSQKGSQGQANSKKKRAGKVVSLAEAAKGSIVFQQGGPCSCQARRHNLVSNCLSCGKIVCEQEGEGPCKFCGALVLREGSSYAGLEESLPPLLSDAEAAAEAYAKRLVEYDRDSAARTTVIDDQSDYYEIDGNSWLSKEEKDLLKKKQEEIEEAERAKRNKVVVTFDLVGRKVLVNEDEVSESDNRILRPADERENRIRPNPTLKIQPVFVDLGFSKKSANDKQSNKGRQSNKGLSKGLCLEITGRVQHDSSDMKYLNNLMMESQLTTESNENFWQVASGNGGLHVEDDGECLLNNDNA